MVGHLGMRASTATLGLLIASACASGEVTLLVEVKTDLAPGVEFTGARARVAPVYDGRRPVGVATRRADRADDARYERGVRIAELGLTPGAFVVEVDLVDASGHAIASREIHIEVRGTTVLTVAIARSCLETTCPAPGGDPVATECLGRRCVPPSCSTGEEPGCERECDDDGDCPTPAAACARAACVDGACFAASDGASCLTGYCDPTRGCVGAPTGDAGTPVPPDASVACGDCDDENPCTDDACSGGTCVHASNAESCDDGIFCNGADVCAGGTCTHAGDPCAAPTTCSEADDACLGCVTSAECPAPSETAWSSCSYPSTCAEAGSQSRAVTTWTCSAGACTSDTRTESLPCTRDTDEMPDCAPTVYGSYGACVFDGECAEVGRRWRTVTHYACQSGVCSAEATSDSGTCARSTTGEPCGTPSVRSSACNYDDPCVKRGMRSRTTTTFTCGAGSCSVPAVETVTLECDRETDGDPCGTELLQCEVGSCFAGSCQVGTTCDHGQRCCFEGCRPDSTHCP